VLLVHGNGQRSVDAGPPPFLLLLGDEDGDPELLLLGHRWRGGGASPRSIASRMP
jgi:hypothetical protein